MAEYYIYKSFDSSNFLFETIWREFPNILTQVETGDKIINKLVLSSKEFCDFRKKQLFNIKIFSEGGFGDVGSIGLNNQIIKSAVFSFERNGKSNVFYTDVIVKLNKHKVVNKIYRMSMNTISLTDPMSDMVFGSILGHLFDIGVCPFVTKYFGNYLCRTNETAMIMEAASFELRNLLFRSNPNRITPEVLENILMQYIYCIYILKIYYGAVHYDTHLRNIMLKDVVNDDYMYHGKNLKNIKYILLETGVEKENTPIVVMIEKSKFLLKLIDYGCLSVNFNISKISKFKRDLIIESNYDDLKAIGADKAIKSARQSESFINTVDLLYTLINLEQFFTLGLDKHDLSRPDPLAQLENRQYIELVNKISKSLFNITTSDLIENNDELKVKKSNGYTYDWFMRNRNSGIMSGFEDPLFLMRGLVRYCKNSIIAPKFGFPGTKYNGKQVIICHNISGHITSIDEENSLFLTHNADDYKTMFNRFENILNYEKKCNSNDIYQKEYCEVIKAYENLPDESFNPQKNKEENRNYKLIDRESNFPENPTYKNYNSWLNSSPIPKDKLNRPIENVKVSLLKIKTYKNISVSTSNPMVYTSGLSFPAGNEVLIGNNVKPLGFFANTLPFEINTNLYPPYYDEYLGVLVYDINNKLKLERYNEFIDRHKTQRIDISDGSELIPGNVPTNPIELKSGTPYKWAITVGPMLIWNNKIVFDENTLNKKVKNKYIFRNRLHKQDADYFSMKNCNEITVQLVFCVRNNHIGLLLVQGGGFYTQGLDKITTAFLCKNLGLEYACCIYSGFNSNILLKNHKQTYLSKSPFRSNHGAVINVEW